MFFDKIPFTGEERKDMKLLIGYLILINLAGLLSMFLDKQRARKDKYRISERSLFLIAAVGGSVGSIAGMYLFRHKTRHKRFIIGLPLILFLQIVILMVAASSFHAQAGRPSTTVRETLDRIQEMDEETIRSFITYKALSDQQITEQDEDAAFDAVRLFFERFQYEITDEQIFGDTATVTVRISNLDTHALAHDLCLQMTSRWIDLHNPSSKRAYFTDYFQLLRSTLTDNQYDTAQTSAHFQLTLENHKWVLQMDQDDRDQIMGGLSSWLKSPYILSPEEVFTLYMESFASLDADGWIEYLGANDLFATGSASFGPKADRIFFETVAELFAWELKECKISGDRAAMKLQITSIDMEKVLSAYHEKLLAFAGTTESITSGSEELSDQTARLLIEALQENAAPAQFPADIEMVNDSVTWEIEDVSPLINAFLGDLEHAMEVMRQT